jgi:ubiquinone/menaquinone biosynthesis C-methylase UbiE
MDSDKVFAGAVPEIYDRYLVPLIFEPYAIDLAARLKDRPIGRLLELAAGTGVVTRTLASSLPADVPIIATDLNQAMLDRAATVGAARPVIWQHADAMHLPFDDESFDVVVCQFGVMFFPDKAQAFAETRRVLAPGGLFIFSVWDDIAENEFADEVTQALATLFPSDPPRFMARTPHGYHDRATIVRDLASGGFTSPRLDTVAAMSRAASPLEPAIAYCQGTPLRNEIETREPGSLDRATEVARERLAARFGADSIEGRIQAVVVTAER